MLTGGDVVLLGFLGCLVALGDVRLDRADQLRLIRVGGGVIFGSDLAGKLISLPAPVRGRHRGGGRSVGGHALAASVALEARRATAVAIRLFLKASSWLRLR